MNVTGAVLVQHRVMYLRGGQGGCVSGGAMNMNVTAAWWGGRGGQRRMCWWAGQGACSLAGAPLTFNAASPCTPACCSGQQHRGPGQLCNELPAALLPHLHRLPRQRLHHPRWVLPGTCLQRLNVLELELLRLLAPDFACTVRRCVVPSHPYRCASAHPGAPPPCHPLHLQTGLAGSTTCRCSTTPLRP